MTDPEWEDPAPSQWNRPRTPKYQALADQLRANPGRWAVLRDKSSSTAHQIKTGHNMAFLPAGHFEAMTRNHHGKRADVYIRYVGPGSEDGGHDDG